MSAARRATRHSTGSTAPEDAEDEPIMPKKVSREEWNLYPGRDRRVARRESAGHEADADDDDEDGLEEDEVEMHAACAPAAALADEDGRRRTRGAAPVRSYKEPGINDIRREVSPPRLHLRVGDELEVEVEEDGTADWQPAEVVKLLSNGRFRARINGDSLFVEEYGPEDEGREWRRRTKYDGLKRQRKSVDHYQPAASLGGGRGREDEMRLSTRVGPFKQVRESLGGGGGRERGGGHRHGARRGSDRESSTDSEGEFDKRKMRSERRLRGNMAPLNARSSGSASVGASFADAAAGGGGGGHNPLQARSPSATAALAAAAGSSAAPSTNVGRRADGRSVLGPGSSAGQASAGDVQPMAVDGSVGWDKVGGLQAHVEALKEMVILPLLYPEVFDTLGVTPPRGVLFHGPPGTGKTLVARALANTCGSAGRPVAFFMRKGADVLSKVGAAPHRPCARAPPAPPPAGAGVAPRPPPGAPLASPLAAGPTRRWSHSPLVPLAARLTHTNAAPSAVGGRGGEAAAHALRGGDAASAVDHLLRRDRRPRPCALLQAGLHPCLDRLHVASPDGRA